MLEIKTRIRKCTDIFLKKKEHQNNIIWPLTLQDGCGNLFKFVKSSDRR